jgi:dextranase
MTALRTFELLPDKAAYAPREAIAVEVRGAGEPGRLTVWHLGDPVAAHPVAGDGPVPLGELPPGGYGVELTCGARTARTALEVTGGDRGAMRYGFVADFRPDRDPADVRDNIRRLHLTDIQFYDWAYRHADLLGGGDDYHDALGQPVSLRTVRRLIDAAHEAGSRALGYAAVYAVGHDEWPTWRHAALLTPGEVPYGLGDFLSLVDPADPGWLKHFTADLAAAADRLGFDGFHLDQYGYPKHARRADGTPVRVEDSFATLVAAARAAVPAARLVFNNVNDFPTWRTAGGPQDAVYIEVWPPHVTLGHLSDVVRRARAAGAGKPVVIAAYQHCYDTAPDSAAADLATAFTMATLFSHGAGHLLCGEADRILVDPYYVRNRAVDAGTADLLARWYDFAVEHGELLTPPDAVEVTGAYAGAYNDDCDVEFAAADVAEHATAGTVWRRVVEVGGRLVVHLINLTGQTDTLWDATREPPGDPGTGTLRIRRSGPGLPRVRVADPDRAPRLTDVPVHAAGDHAVARLPAPRLWQVVVIDR